MKHKRAVRWSLLALSIAATLFVIYASFVPLRFRELPWDEAVAMWQQIPWLNLSIGNRADWVANGLIMLPPGFFAAGAVGFRRKSQFLLWIAAPVIVAALSAVVVGIELVQVFFPPRVVSQNDILAGLIGSLVGVLLWSLLGNRLSDQLERFFQLEPGLQRWLWLAQASVVALCLYNLLPLDVILNGEELQQKWQKGGFSLVPLQDIPSEVKPRLKWLVTLAVATSRIVPFAFMATICKGPKFALSVGIAAAVAIEATKVPIYSREFSTTDIIASILGVVVTIKVAAILIRCILLFDKKTFWLLGGVFWCGVMAIAFLTRFDEIVRDPELLQERAWDIFAVPFARAHSSREFDAGVNILLKWIAFGTLAFLVCGWQSRRISTRKPGSNLESGIPWFSLVLSGAFMGISIEAAQVFLLPLVPDATDWLTYSVGMLLGVLAFRLLMPDQEVLRIQIEQLVKKPATERPVVES